MTHSLNHIHTGINTQTPQSESMTYVQKTVEKTENLLTLEDRKNPLEHIESIDFSRYIRIPRDKYCTILDPKRMETEFFPKDREKLITTNPDRLLIEWPYAIILGYRREKNEQYYRGFVLSFNYDERSGITVTQLQWSTDKHIGFRMASSLNYLDYFVDLLEESFLKKHIPVTVTTAPNGLDNARPTAGSQDVYNIMRSRLTVLSEKYGL